MNAVTLPGGPVLTVPCVDPGKGRGHLARCAALVQDLLRQGREAFLYLEGDVPLASLNSLLGSSYAKGKYPSWLISCRKEAEERFWELIILDRFQTPPEEYAFWSSLAPILGIDEGGCFREDFDFLLDLLPGPPGRLPPNLLDPSLLPLPSHRRPDPVPGSPSKGGLRLLISFGAEDQSRLGALAAEALMSGGKDLDITLLDPARGKIIPELREHLTEYDLLITHFGLTAFEAIYVGLAVLIVSPGKYHEKLARTAGFFSAGIGRQGTRRLPALLIDSSGLLKRGFVEELRRRCAAIATRYGLDKVPNASFGLFVGGLRLQGNFQRDRPCPACGATAWDPVEILDRGEPPEAPLGSAHQVLARFPARTYRHCPRCGMVYMNRLNEPPIEYAEEYFFGSYKKQYGKTYLEDFPQLVSTGKRRLELIASLLADQDTGDPPQLLDIGCAYGPFLKAASEQGFQPLGIDPAGEAVAYVNRELKLPAIQGFFPLETPLEIPLRQAGLLSDGRLPGLFQNESFSVISLWYVIEHFREPRLALKEVKRLLKPGGVLAFATPSFRGISGRKSPAAFLKNSPADHWTVWSPGICRSLLKGAGFRVKKIVITGHHPERFPLGGILFKKKTGLLYRFFLLLSRLFRLGDTFEVYAVKD